MDKMLNLLAKTFMPRAWLESETREKNEIIAHIKVLRKSKIELEDRLRSLGNTLGKSYWSPEFREEFLGDTLDGARASINSIDDSIAEWGRKLERIEAAIR